jgi:hypothetical protein
MGRGGKYVGDVTPDPHAMTVRERTSFIELPGPGFTPRRFDPRAGYFPSSYRDYTAPLGEPLDQQFIERHRLVKKDPNCVKACEAVAPIQYYVDRGAPEPIRTALVEGARWWDQAFQAAGWAKGTFRVDVLPAGRPDGCALQHHPVGASLHARLELRRGGDRSADGRDYQGQCDAGVAARAAGLHDCRGAACALQGTGSFQNATPAHDPMLQMVLRACGSWRRMRPGTRWDWRITLLHRA